MTRKRVLLVVAGRFMGGVIGSLFHDVDDIQLLEARPASQKELLNVVCALQPDIVVIDDTLGGFLALLLKYMQRTDGLRIVVVSAESNHVEVYQKQQIPIIQPADLFSVL